MMGHKIRLYGELWLIIPKLSVTGSSLEHTLELTEINVQLRHCFCPCDNSI